MNKTLMQCIKCQKWYESTSERKYCYECKPGKKWIKLEQDKVVPKPKISLQSAQNTIAKFVKEHGLSRSLESMYNARKEVMKKKEEYYAIDRHTTPAPPKGRGGRICSDCGYKLTLDSFSMAAGKRSKICHRCRWIQNKYGMKVSDFYDFEKWNR